MRMAQIQHAKRSLEVKETTVLQETVFNAQGMETVPTLLQFAQKRRFLEQLFKPIRALGASQTLIVRLQTRQSQFVTRALHRRQFVYTVRRILIAAIKKSASITNVDAMTTLIAASQQEYVLVITRVFLGAKQISSVRQGIQGYQAALLDFRIASMASVRSVKETGNVRITFVARITAVSNALTAQIAIWPPMAMQRTV
jgi:hypothetical protein